MTKEEITKEIIKLRKKVDSCTVNIHSYNKKIETLENNYNKSNLLISKYQSYLDNYYSSILHRINGLDRDSNFSSFYRNRLNNIFSGRENNCILDSVSRGKKDLINQINKYEEKISYENQKKLQYKQKIHELETKLKLI